MNKQKIIAFDLDDVICSRPKQIEHLGVSKYDYCEPNLNVIDIINSLYEDGHIILIYTARGMSHFSGDVSKIYSNLYEKTISQLKSWKVQYHQLVMGKLHYDVLIDDKAINSLNINKDTIINFLQ